jgi:hypothetical protein
LTRYTDKDIIWKARNGKKMRRKSLYLTEARILSRNTQLTNRRQKRAGKKPTTTESNECLGAGGKGGGGGWGGNEMEGKVRRYEGGGVREGLGAWRF